MSAHTINSPVPRVLAIVLPLLLREPRSALKNGRLPALVWKIHLLHGAQTRLVQNAAIAGDAPGTLSRLGTERIQGQCPALLKITQEIPVSLQACHGGQRGKPGRGGPGILLRL